MDFLSGLYFYASSGWVPAELTVVGEFVPFDDDEFAIVWGLTGVKIERSRFASVTCVGAPEVSGGRNVRSHGRDLMSLGSVGADELALFCKEMWGLLECA